MTKEMLEQAELIINCTNMNPKPTPQELIEFFQLNINITTPQV